VTPATCGDGTVQAAYEKCDLGGGNSNATYGSGACTTTCHYGPYCGDAVITNSEVCDDGVNNGTSLSSCGTDCLPKCGNGVLDPTEQCDNGRANNVGGYAACNPDCTLGPRCGDGIKNGPELCDDGKNDGTYGMCAPGCIFGPRCGDAVVQAAAGEVCDMGAANLPVATAYGNGKCTVRCKPAPYCGDKEVDVAFGEKCDDGKNDGTPGSCLPDCSGYVPLLSCGDAIVQPPKEQCDEGTAKNGTAASTCDAHCKWKCGNGVKDPGEDCDDGVNNGSYGTCKADCKLAGYCGDSVKNGPEECDLGPGNEANPYGPNKCTTSCLYAPFCGDGRIQSAFGEQCDGGYGCTATCLFSIIN
jgi:hypothetical protein